MLRRPFLILVSFACLVASSVAEPLSKKSDIDFFRDVPSRNLKGLASRSDGRLVAGPTLSELPGPAPADLMWCLEPGADPAKWLVGTGPDGRVVEITLDHEKPGFTARDFAKLDDPQVFALKRRADGSVVAGTSPKGALYLIRDEKPIARVLLPVDSIFDLLLLDEDTVLAATGNPGRIYKIDLKRFESVGWISDKITDTKILADRGITLFGEIRDRNVRRIAALPDGRIVAGSAPRGNVYAFAQEGGSPVILQENRDAEVTDLLPQPNGDLFATIVFSATTGQARITPPTKAGERRDEPPPLAQVERFGGRSALILFPANGFPETLTARSNMAFYSVARLDDTLIVAGGEQGELIGFDLKARLSLTFAGSISSQLNGIALLPLPADPDQSQAADTAKFLLLRNNAPGFAVLAFDAGGLREAETRRLDLGTPAQLGALRFSRLRNLPESSLAPEIRTSHGSDEVEGWGPWTPLVLSEDGGWRAEDLRGRYVKLRLQIDERRAAVATSPSPPPATAGARTSPAAAPPARRLPMAANPASAESLEASPQLAGLPRFEINRSVLFWLPQNRRPQLQDFRVLTPGYGVIPAAEQPPSPIVSLRNLMDPPREDDRRRSSFLSSQVVPVRGARVVIWNVTDPDGDRLVYTFSIRREGDADWVDLAAESRDSFVQFDTAHLRDGVYFTRLVATETAPRPPGERLSQTFETDDLIIDHTPPELIEATAHRTADSIVITVHGRDELSLLDGIEVVFNNGVRETVEQPVDGVRDGREETFMLDIPIARVWNATTVEITLYDAAGNGTARRLTW